MTVLDVTGRNVIAGRLEVNVTMTGSTTHGRVLLVVDGVLVVEAVDAVVVAGEVGNGGGRYPESNESTVIEDIKFFTQLFER